MSARPLVLFVCNHNAGRSQMAEAYLRLIGSDKFETASAGSNPAPALNPVVVQAMAEDGIDISAALPKAIDPGMLARAQHVISMGCEDGCLTRTDENWELTDPARQPIETVRGVRDEIKRKVIDFVERDRGGRR